MTGRWYSFWFAVAAFVAGLAGLILKWDSPVTSWVFLVLGALGIVFIGWPIWAAMLKGMQDADPDDPSNPYNHGRWPPYGRL